MTCQNFYSRINRTPIIFTKTHADMSNIILNLIETDPPQCIQKFAVISQDFHSFSCNDRISLQRQLLFRATPKQGQNQIKIQKSVIEIRNVSPNFFTGITTKSKWPPCKKKSRYKPHLGDKLKKFPTRPDSLWSVTNAICLAVAMEAYMEMKKRTATKCDRHGNNQYITFRYYRAP